jgi:broad specificity phosphatase PhoE
LSVVPFGGESRSEVEHRVYRALYEMMDTTDGETILAVSHGSTIGLNNSILSPSNNPNPHSLRSFTHQYCWFGTAFSKASDSPLTALGVQQANAAQQYFKTKNIHFDYLYSSPQQRAFACCTPNAVKGESLAPCILPFKLNTV